MHGETVKYTNYCLYRVDPPDDEQQACSKHVEAYYWNKLIENSAHYLFVLRGYITMHGQQNIKFKINLYALCKFENAVTPLYYNFYTYKCLLSLWFKVSAML